MSGGRSRQINITLDAIKVLASLTNFEVQSPVTEAFLLGCLTQRFPGERFEWDSAAGRVTNSEKATKYLDTPARSAYRV